jgi:hypothetical protein
MSFSLAYWGFDYVSYYNGGYENADSLGDLALTGANSAGLNLEYGINVNTSTIYADANYTDSLTALGNTISEARSLGLSVMVKPLIDFLDPSKIGPNAVGDWRAYFNPANPAAFFASYKSMMVAEAQVAQAHGATVLSIGTELDQLTGPQYWSYWTDIISSVRAVFSGKLTYSADWNDNTSPWQGHNGLTAGTGNLATQVSFWSQLDYVGLDVYAPLSDAANPTLANLIAGWNQMPTDTETKAVTGNQSLISYFESVAAQTGKPLLFTEIGYESATDAASQPAGSSTNVYDPTLQTNLYAAFFDAWKASGDSSLKGVYFWNWDPNAAEVGPGNGANFSPQGLPAEDVVKANFKTMTIVTAPGVGLANDTGSSNSDKITKDPTLTLSGVVPGALVEYSLDGTHWSATAPTVATLAQGIDTVLVRQTDMGGNVSNATSVTFTLDTVNPNAPGVALADDTGSSGSDKITEDPTLALSGVEPGALVEYSLDGAHWSATAPRVATLAQGIDTVMVRQTDVAGNVSDATSFTFTLDTVNPNAPGVALADDTGSNRNKITTDPTLALSGVEPGALVEYSLDGTHWSTMAPTVGTLVLGSDTVMVRQTDVAGNVSDITSITFTLVRADLSNDFNGDGTSDILWHDAQTQQLGDWIMHGNGPTWNLLSNNTSGWSVVGSGDYNGGGTSDILWYNAKSQQLGDWTTLGANPAWTLLTNNTTGWIVVGSGDYNGDGTSDILWYNAQSQQLADWLMHGNSPTWNLLSNNVSGWTVVGNGDYNGDGTSDVLWYNTQSQQLGDWIMHNNSPTWNLLTNNTSSWTVVGNGDYNGDGTSDILWYNAQTQQLGDWIMHDNSPTWNLLTNNTNGWTVVGSGDYNGDGTSDILWYNAQTQQLGDWIMHGNSPTWNMLSTNTNGWSVTGSTS